MVVGTVSQQHGFPRCRLRRQRPPRCFRRIHQRRVGSRRFAHFQRLARSFVVDHPRDGPVDSVKPGAQGRMPKRDVPEGTGEPLRQQRSPYPRGLGDSVHSRRGMQLP